MSEQRRTGGPTSGRLLGDGPFEEGVEQTRVALWVAVLLMVGGFALLGLAVVLASLTTLGAIISAVVGVVVGVAGAVLARRRHIMQDVE